MKSLLLLCVCVLALFGASPELPRVFIETRLPSHSGQAIDVPAGGNLQAALDVANSGDTIYLEPGATYTAAFVARKSNAEFVTIRTRTELPSDDRRISTSAKLARIVSPDSRPAFNMSSTAARYRLLGVELTTTAPTIWNVVLTQPGSKHLIVDRCYVHGGPKVQSFRGVLMDGDSIAVVNSAVTDIHYEGFDSQAVGGSMGGGPYKIVNNLLEGAGENIMFGGSRPAEGIVPSDIEVRRNWIRKPLEWEQNTATWDGSKWTIKNLFELKSARRVLVEDNVLENHWSQAQTGQAVLFTVRSSQSGAWAVVNDVTFRRNIVRNTHSGFSVMGYDTLAALGQNGESKRVLIEGNLIVLRPSSSAIACNIARGPEDLQLVNNTFAWSAPVRFGLFFAGSNPIGTGFASINNVWPRQPLGDGMGFGAMTLAKYVPEPAPIADRFTGNVSWLPPGDTVRLSPAPIPGNVDTKVNPFLDPAAGDFRVRPDVGTAGADIPALLSMAAAVSAEGALSSSCK